MESYQQPKKEITLDTTENLKSTVSHVKKALNTLRSTNDALSEKTSMLKKIAEQIHFNKTREYTIRGDIQFIEKRLEQYVAPKVNKLTNHTDAKLARLANEKQLLQKRIQAQHERINSFSPPKQMNPAEMKTTLKGREEQLIRSNKQLKQELGTIINEKNELAKEVQHITRQIQVAKAKVSSYRPDLSRIKAARLELEEEKGKLIELENERKQKLEQRRNVGDFEEKEPEDQTQSAVQSLSSDDKDELIQHILSQITQPEFIESMKAPRSIISKSIKEAKRYKDTFPKKNHPPSIHMSDPKAVEEWLKIKCDRLGISITSDPLIAKTVGGVIELLVRNSRVSIADLEREFPLFTDQYQPLLFHALYLLNKAGSIQIEENNFVFKM